MGGSKESRSAARWVGCSEYYWVAQWACHLDYWWETVWVARLVYQWAGRRAVWTAVRTAEHWVERKAAL